MVAIPEGISRLRGGLEDWEKEYEKEAHEYTQCGTSAADAVRHDLPKPWEDRPLEEYCFGPGDEHLIPDLSGFYQGMREAPDPPELPPLDATDEPTHDGWTEDVGRVWDGVDPRLKMVGFALKTHASTHVTQPPCFHPIEGRIPLFCRGSCDPACATLIWRRLSPLSSTQCNKYDQFTPEQFTAMGVEGTYWGPDGTVHFAPPGYTAETMLQEIEAGCDYLCSLG